MKNGLNSQNDLNGLNGVLVIVREGFLFAKIIIILNLNLTIGIGRKRRNNWCEQGQIESQIFV